ncbi:MAG: MmgE/PrpD family protein [Chloroflexi bacterium]|nr:MmgE/PrpD family protein [Chloroflexota bacterium]
MSTLTERFAELVHGLRYDQVPEVVREKAKALVAHGLAVGLVSYDLEPARIARHVLTATEPLESGARILVDGNRVTVGGAVFANSTLMHARNADDAYHTAPHIGCAVIPVALAVAETTGASGRAVLEAIIAGYEVSAYCIGDFVGPSTRKGFRASSIYDTFGAAATAGRLLGLSQSQIADALGIAASGSAGLLQGLGESRLDWKFQPGQAARAGYFAAVLAQAGVTGARQALEGPQGFYRAFCGLEEVPDFLAELGRRWEILEVTSKLFPVAMYNQTPLRTVLRLRREHDLTPDQIERVDVEMADFEVNYPGAKFKGPFEPGVPPPSSIPYVIATGFAHGAGTLAAQLATDHPATLALLDRIEVRGSATRQQSTCRIVVRTRSGQELVGEAPEGPPYYQLTWDRAVNAIRELQAESPLSLEPLAQAVSGLETARDVGAVLRACTR